MKLNHSSCALLSLLLYVTTFNVIITPSTPILSTDVLPPTVIFQSPFIPQSTYTLIGNNASLSRIVAYEFTPSLSLLRPSHHSYTPYTEGFVRSILVDDALSSIQNNHATLSTYFHDILYTQDILYVAFPGTLKHLFAIDCRTGNVKRLDYLPSDDLGQMYVSDMSTTQDFFIIVGAKAHSYDLLIYLFDKTSLKFYSSHQLTASPKVMNSQHLFISSTGFIYFLGTDSEIIQYDPFTSTSTALPTALEGSHLLAYKESFITLNHDSYTLYVDSPKLGGLLTLPLPTPNAQPIDFLVDDDYLISLFINPSTGLFTHYLSIYHLPSSSWESLTGLTLPPKLLLTDLLLEHF